MHARPFLAICTAAAAVAAQVVATRTPAAAGNDHDHGRAQGCPG
jgi:hypothetical protein